MMERLRAKLSLLNFQVHNPTVQNYNVVIITLLNISWNTKLGKESEHTE